MHSTKYFFIPLNITTGKHFSREKLIRQVFILFSPFFFTTPIIEDYWYGHWAKHFMHFVTRVHHLAVEATFVKSRHWKKNLFLAAGARFAPRNRALFDRVTTHSHPPEWPSLNRWIVASMPTARKEFTCNFRRPVHGWKGGFSIKRSVTRGAVQARGTLARILIGIARELWWDREELEGRGKRWEEGTKGEESRNVAVTGCGQVGAKHSVYWISTWTRPPANFHPPSAPPGRFDEHRDYRVGAQRTEKKRAIRAGIRVDAYDKQSGTMATRDQ